MAAIRGHSFNTGPYGKNNEKSSHLKLFGQLGPKFGEMVFWWSPLKMYPVDWRSVQADIILT